MKYDVELKAETGAIQQQMVEAKKNERANALKEVKRLCKEFGLLLECLKSRYSEEHQQIWWCLVFSIISRKIKVHEI